MEANIPRYENLIRLTEDGLKTAKAELETAKKTAEAEWAGEEETTAFDWARKQVKDLETRLEQHKVTLADWKGLVPDVESLVRVASGYRAYVYDPDRSGPVAGRFKGARMTGQHNRPIFGSYDYVESRREGRAEALQTDDVNKIGWGGRGC